MTITEQLDELVDQTVYVTHGFSSIEGLLQYSRATGYYNVTVIDATHGRHANTRFRSADVSEVYQQDREWYIVLKS